LLAFDRVSSAYVEKALLFDAPQKFFSAMPFGVRKSYAFPASLKKIMSGSAAELSGSGIDR
jgi:hypothetical protein